MFIPSDQIIILFPADTFSRKQLIFRPHYKRNKYKLLEKWSCVSVWICFAPTSSRYSKFGSEKKTAFDFEKKKKKKILCSISHCFPYWKPVWLDWNWGIIHKCSRTYRNNAILSFDFIICQSEQFTMAVHLIFTHLIQWSQISIFKVC